MAAIQFIKVGTTAQNMATIPAPDDWGWMLSDISASDAGRTQDANVTMYKNRVAQKRKLTPVWKNRNATTVAAILQAFNPEYVYVRYWDTMDNQFETRQFYTGDKSAAMTSFTLGGVLYSSLSFDLIER